MYIAIKKVIHIKTKHKSNSLLCILFFWENEICKPKNLSGVVNFRFSSKYINKETHYTYNYIYIYMVCLVYINYIYIYMNPYKKNDPDTFITKIVMRVHTHTHTHTQTISRSLTSTRTHSARYRKIDLCFLSNWTNHEHIFSSYTSPYISPWRFTILLTVIYF